MKGKGWKGHIASHCIMEWNKMCRGRDTVVASFTARISSPGPADSQDCCWKKKCIVRVQTLKTPQSSFTKHLHSEECHPWPGRTARLLPWFERETVSQQVLHIYESTRSQHAMVSFHSTNLWYRDLPCGLSAHGPDGLSRSSVWKLHKIAMSLCPDPDRSWQNEAGSLKVAQAEFVPGRDNSIHVHLLHLSQKSELGSFEQPDG